MKECQTCWNTWLVDVECDECDNGWIECLKCDGDGWYECDHCGSDVDCDECGRDGGDNCETCEGEGVVEKPCPDCGLTPERLPSLPGQREMFDSPEGK